MERTVAWLRENVQRCRANGDVLGTLRWERALRELVAR